MLTYKMSDLDKYDKFLTSTFLIQVLLMFHIL